MDKKLIGEASMEEENEREKERERERERERKRKWRGNEGKIGKEVEL